jgi:hypothetical protein
MSLHHVFYEFKLSRQVLSHLVEDVGLTHGKLTTEQIVDLFYSAKSLDETEGGDYILAFRFLDVPGLRVKIGTALKSDQFNDTIEGLEASIHASSEGMIDLTEFCRYTEASLKLHGYDFTKH